MGGGGVGVWVVVLEHEPWTQTVTRKWINCLYLFRIKIFFRSSLTRTCASFNSCLNNSIQREIYIGIHKQKKWSKLCSVTSDNINHNGLGCQIGSYWFNTHAQKPEVNNLVLPNYRLFEWPRGHRTLWELSNSFTSDYFMWYRWLKEFLIYSTGCFCNFTCWDFGGWGDCSQPCPRSTLRHRPRCDKHSVTNPTRLIAIN